MAWKCSWCNVSKIETCIGNNSSIVVISSKIVQHNIITYHSIDCPSMLCHRSRSIPCQAPRLCQLFVNVTSPAWLNWTNWKIHFCRLWFVLSLAHSLHALFSRMATLIKTSGYRSDLKLGAMIMYQPKEGSPKADWWRCSAHWWRGLRATAPRVSIRLYIISKSGGFAAPHLKISREKEESVQRVVQGELRRQPKRDVHRRRRQWYSNVYCTRACVTTTACHIRTARLGLLLGHETRTLLRQQRIGHI